MRCDVLITESAAELDDFERRLIDEIKPTSELARIYFNDFVAISWEIKRYWRTKNTLVNSQYRSALANLYNQLIRPPEIIGAEAEDVAEMADGGRCNIFDESIKKLLEIGETDFVELWFADSVVRSQFHELLRKYRLDEGCIEAEAIRLLSRDLEDIDRMLMSLELRRDRIMRLLDTLQSARNADRATDRKLLPLGA